MYGAYRLASEIHSGERLFDVLSSNKEQIEFTRDKPYLYSLIAKVGHTVVGVLKVVIPFLSTNKNTLLLASRVISLAFI